MPLTKQCEVCEKPLVVKNYRAYTKAHRKCYLKACEASREAARKATHKSCIQCEQAKPITDFYPDKELPDGRKNLCKTCSKLNRVYNKHRLEAKLPPKVLKQERDKMNENSRRYYQRTRRAALAAYGGACACCGEGQEEFLAIDHINGKGGEHRRKLGRAASIFVWLKKNNYPEGFRVLCHNCNCSLGFYGYCPHNLNHLSHE